MMWSIRAISFWDEGNVSMVPFFKHLALCKEIIYRQDVHLYYVLVEFIKNPMSSSGLGALVGCVWPIALKISSSEGI